MNLLIWLTSFLTSISFLFFFPPLVFAKIEVMNSPTKIEINKEFELDISLTNLSNPIHFLSIAFHKKSGDPYFGQTKSGDSWIEADDNNCKIFPQATVVEGTWSGKLVGKFFYDEKDFDNSLGNYILKIFKYTDSCNKSSSDDIMIELFDPSPPPISTPIAIPTLVPTRTNTPFPSATVKPQSTSAPIKLASTVTKIPSLTLPSSPSATSFVSSPFLTSTSESAVLGETTNQGVTMKKEEEQKEKKNTNTFSILLIILGSLCVGIACILSYRQIKKSRMKS